MRKRAVLLSLLFASAGSPLAWSTLAGVRPDDGSFRPAALLPAPSAHPGYTEEEIEFFLEVALDAEYASSPVPPAIKRWPVERLPAIRLGLEGYPTARDRAVVSTVAAEINAILGMPLVAVVDGHANVPVRFVPHRRIREFTRLAPRGAGGFASIQVGPDYTIRSGQVLVAEDIPFRGRAAIIREELTQVLGLLNDSDRIPSSIFSDGNFATEYSRIDRALIEMLYHPAIAPGLKEAEARWRLLMADRLSEAGVLASPGAGSAGGG